MAKASNTLIYEKVRQAAPKPVEVKVPLLDYEAVQTNLYKMGYTVRRLEKTQKYIKIHTEPRQ